MGEAEERRRWGKEERVRKGMEAVVVTVGSRLQFRMNVSSIPAG